MKTLHEAFGVCHTGSLSPTPPLLLCEDTDICDDEGVAIPTFIKSFACVFWLKPVVPGFVAGAVPSVEHGVESLGLGIDHNAVAEKEGGAKVLVDCVQLLLAAEDGWRWLCEVDLGSVFVAGVDAEDHLGCEGWCSGGFYRKFSQTVLNLFVFYN